MSEHPTSALSRAPEPDDGGPAFPEAGLSGLPNGAFIHGRPGMSLRAYFMAHAPAEPQAWFRPAGCAHLEDFHHDWKRQRYLQWPAAWADEQLAILKGQP